MVFNIAKTRVGAFSENDGTIDFYLRCRALGASDSVVLDLGAGRGGWYIDDQCATRKEIRLLRGTVRHVIAADLDAAVLQNECSDSQVLIENDDLGLEDESVDLIIADYVLEHVEDVKEFYRQVNSVLNKGGWFCARTPHKYSYPGLAASIIGNRFHQSLLKYIQPGRKAEDVFPTYFRMNTVSEISRLFQGWEDKTFVYRVEPSYFFGNKFLFYILSFFHRLLPAFVSGNIFIFVRKP